MNRPRLWIALGCVLPALWLVFGLGLALGARDVTATVAAAMAKNEATREQVMQRFLDSTCVVRLTNPLQVRIR